jgi:hypothetical protein
MKANQLFQAISPELQSEILSHLETQHKPAFDMAVVQLCGVRRFRPVFIQSRPIEAQRKFILEQLHLKTGSDLAAQVIQLWLLKGQQGMLKTFLDAVGIEHKDGEVETLPEEIKESDAKKGIKALLDSTTAEKAAVYLHTFQTQRPGGWEGLTKAMEAEPKLKLGA